MLSLKEIDFIIKNEKEDVSRLLFAASNKNKNKEQEKDINIQLCVKCILAREKMKTKAPLWYDNPALVYPFAVSVEQGSSQATALFKQQIIKNLLKDCKTINTADLTGGMGIDSFFISQISNKHYYFESNTQLFEATKYNLAQLGADNIVFSNVNTTANNNEAVVDLKDKDISLIYIDPARRSQTNTKTILLQDYEPNVLNMLDDIFSVTDYVLIKVSPMADIKLNIKLLKNIMAVYVVALENECKELLFVLHKDCNLDSPQINCINLGNNGQIKLEELSFTYNREDNCNIQIANSVEEYLYEPNKAILKGGAYKLVSQMFNLKKLSISTHLYTSNNFIGDFPGKIYKVEQSFPFSKKVLKEIALKYPKADITARNFPLDTNALKKLSSIKDGGQMHIFACTIGNNSKTLIIAKRV